MTKAEILTLIQDIARGQADDDTIAVYYYETINELGRLVDPPMADAELFSLTSGTATYSYPDNAVSILCAFFEGYQLSRETEENLEAYERTWRNDSGDPVAFKTADETTDSITFYPIPSSTSAAFIPVVGQPLGEEFPADMAVLIYSEARDTNILDPTAMYIVFRVLYKEFIRPSDHQDVDWAVLLGKLAQLFYHLGVKRKRRDDEQ